PSCFSRGLPIRGPRRDTAHGGSHFTGPAAGDGGARPAPRQVRMHPRVPKPFRTTPAATQRLRGAR
ncbi:MAG: hypothetical protein ACKVQA_22525, partial [Burkholderiales bacterium]